MSKALLFVLVAFPFWRPSCAHAEDVMVYTAHQDWPSRIYVLRMDGSVVHYFEYWYYRFVDTEVVNNELYAADAFAPRVYRVDLATGNLNVVIDDWTLYYFYGLAFDGTYFYVDEWDLNRYDINGDKDGTAPFDEDVMGAAWDGEYYWALDDGGQITCWDITGWPTVIEMPGNAFSAPTADCRGLWFDGGYFWSAESKELLGYIYKFDYEGQVVAQWLQPAFSGWSACVIEGFLPDPITLTGAVVGGELVLDWTACSGAQAYWVYGAVNEAYFESGFAPGYQHRLAVLSPLFRTWSSPNGIGQPDSNWTYLVLAVDTTEEELSRSNRYGEQDFDTSN